MFDQFVLIIVGFFTVLALFRGFIRELLGILGLVVSILCTYSFTSYVTAILLKQIPSFLLAQFISGSLVFVFMLIVTGIVNSFIANMLQFIRHGVLDTILGGILGFTKGCLVCFLIYTITLFAVPILNPGIDIDDECEDAVMPSWLTNSRVYPVFLQTKNYINSHILIDYDKHNMRFGTVIQKQDDQNRSDGTESPQKEHQDTGLTPRT